jgi:aurora kinase
MNSNRTEINKVNNRFLPIPESTIKGYESEPNIKDFEIIREIGAGSFGRVFLARHKHTRVKYAIKAIDKKNKTNIKEKPYFRRELEVMYKIHHPNVVKLFGHFEDNNFCYFIMEYINKGNVYSLLTLDKKRKLSPHIVASIIKDVIYAIFFLHNMNPPIIHRDIKPENVLLTEELTAKLTDFGWSNYISEEDERRTVCGTPIYLAPEIIKEHGHDERVDVWCIGVLLFELITGSVPFTGSDIDTLKTNILHLKISWPKDINQDVKNLISKILKIEPSQRLSLEEILNEPFITKYFPDALNGLILPDPNAQYNTFIVSRDDPRTWDPFQKNYPNTVSNNNKKERQDKYSLLKEKYHNLKNDYYQYKNGNESLNEIEELKRKIREKNEIIEKLIKGNETMNKLEENEKQLKNKCNDLENENYDLRNQVIAYEQQIKDEQIKSIDSKLNEFRDTLTSDELDYGNAFEDLKNHLDNETRQNLNEILKNKDREIEKYKEEEKIRREKEKKKYATLINKYDQTLSWVERENEDLKRKIKELESKLPKK